jgi:uncharacterized metal-binding protein
MQKYTSSKTLLFIPCSGASYHGELARQVAIHLVENSPLAPFSSMLCFTIFLRHNLLHEKKSVFSMKNLLSSSFTIAIDGCTGACALKIFQFLKITPALTINLQQLIPKESINYVDSQAVKTRPRLSAIKPEDVEKVSTYILNQLLEKQILKPLT